MSVQKKKESKKKGEIENNANIIIYFNDDILNTSESVTFTYSRPAFFSILYTMSFAELEDEFCQCIDADTPKTVEKNKI